MGRRSLFRRLVAGATLLAGFVLGPAPDHARTALLVYDFDLAMAPADVVPHLRSLGFDGVVARCTRPADVAKLGTYAQAAQGTPGFQVLAYVKYDFDNPASPQVCLDALPILGATGAPLWVIVDHAPTVADADAALLHLAQQAASFGVSVVIYPHWDTSIESAAAADAAIARIGHPALRNSLHTCHEIRAGNQGRLDRVAERFAASSDLVTIAGADQGAYAGSDPAIGHDWSDAIQPLDRGSFDLSPFLDALERADYRGRVVLHTYGIAGDPGHRARSHDWYTAERLGLR